jgi:ribosome-binding factor A
MSYRAEQLNHLIGGALNEVLAREIEWPQGVFPTVSKIDVAPNLQSCKIFISAIPSDKTNLAVGVLVKQKGLIKKELAKRIRRLRAVPDLIFVPDFSEEKAFEIENLIDSLNQ